MIKRIDISPFESRSISINLYQLANCMKNSRSDSRAMYFAWEPDDDNETYGN